MTCDHDMMLADRAELSNGAEESWMWLFA